ncbi:MAG: Fic family protein [Alphaproteobacteria bacterium]|nr:Fic family protein [Alphaproteobacteria bacterium]
MTWNWQQKDWPDFRYNSSLLRELEDAFLKKSGVFLGAYTHIADDDKSSLIIDLISDEAVKTSEIEGEYLNRESVQSSIRQNFGLAADNRKIPLAEQGISEMMVDLYQNYNLPLTHEILFRWHTMLTRGKLDLKDAGCYRTHQEPMQVVSGYIHAPKVHFEAPPSKVIFHEMEKFIGWFNKTAPGGKEPLPALTRVGMAHLYFVCIHPFEDGNGRIGRAIAEKVLSQSLQQPTLIALSHTIEKNKKAYYDALESNNKDMEITPWLLLFAETVLKAQEYTQDKVLFLIEKTKLYDKLRNQLNPRQEKVIARLFREGPDGFKGGLNTEKYIRMTGTSRATATRDLQDLVHKGALGSTGERKGTRYHLNIRL